MPTVPIAGAPGIPIATPACVPIAPAAAARGAGDQAAALPRRGERRSPRRAVPFRARGAAAMKTPSDPPRAAPAADIPVIADALFGIGERIEGHLAMIAELILERGGHVDRLRAITGDAAFVHAALVDGFQGRLNRAVLRNVSRSLPLDVKDTLGAGDRDVALLCAEMAMKES